MLSIAALHSTRNPCFVRALFSSLFPKKIAKSRNDICEKYCIFNEDVRMIVYRFHAGNAIILIQIDLKCNENSVY